mmetsp:Transcript_86571/g.273234  ORF Transcript_86571/g.273234 Transcript_86571/m.273234 type:complete len:85 (-) Transcript_86571:694-948(-)
MSLEATAPTSFGGGLSCEKAKALHGGVSPPPPPPPPPPCDAREGVDADTPEEVREWLERLDSVNRCFRVGMGVACTGALDIILA